MSWEGPDPRRQTRTLLDLRADVSHARLLRDRWLWLLEEWVWLPDEARTSQGGSSVTEILERFGYDPDDPVRGLDIPDRLIEDLDLEIDEDSE